MIREILIGVLVLTAPLAMAGCQDVMDGNVDTNRSPDTELTAGPPSLEQTSFSVPFFWKGSDDDGWVDHFEWRISSNGPDGIVSPEDTLGLPWNATVATDSVFVVAADMDSFPVDVDNPDIVNPRDYRFWQTHTFFVRAVDNDGAPDDSPAAVSFTATTIAPTVNITSPSNPGGNSCVTSARALTFKWKGDDPDEITGEPAFSRYALVNVTDVNVPGQEPLPKGACLTRIEYEALNPVAYFRDEDWSEWIPYAAGEDSGRVATFPVKDIGESFFFAAQVMDVAGAVTPTFQWNQNVRHVVISPGKFPSITVTEKFLGIESFGGDGKIRSFEIVAGQPLEFSWQADATSYAGIVEAYRFGWEIQDVNDSEDPGWSVPWGKGASFLRAPVRSFQQGSPNFVVQCRDNSGEVSRATYQFEVIQITPRAQQFDLLFIDDYGLGDTPQELGISLEWRGEWELLLSRVVNFDPAVDYYVAAQASKDIDFRLVNRYKAVIWFTMATLDRSVFDETLRPQAGQVRYNWLEVYQAKVGNLLFVGPYAALGSIEPTDTPLVFPLIFNTEDRPPDGLGCETQFDGSCIPRGTLRWPYTGWCLDAADIVRPQGQGRFGEVAGSPSTTTSTFRCDYLFRAEVAPQFLQYFASANGVVEDLDSPVNSPRIPDASGFPDKPAFYKYAWEEFYNRNIVEAKSVTISPRDCQIPMFLYRAVRDEVYPPGHDNEGEPMVANADSVCVPQGNEFSPINGASNAVASLVYSDFKQLPGSQDFLWGFHPLAFNLTRVESALLWIIGQNWDIDVTN